MCALVLPVLLRLLKRQHESIAKGSQENSVQLVSSYGCTSEQC